MDIDLELLEIKNNGSFNHVMEGDLLVARYCYTNSGYNSAIMVGRNKGLTVNCGQQHSFTETLAYIHKFVTFPHVLKHFYAFGKTFYFTHEDTLEKTANRLYDAELNELGYLILDHDLERATFMIGNSKRLGCYATLSPHSPSDLACVIAMESVK